jgi:hypothetical protein
MSIKMRPTHESLSRIDGFIFDSEMNYYMMWKQHEFGQWWRSFESLFTHPLSRTFINSVVDDLEYHQRLSHPRGLFKKKKFDSELAQLAHFYGSGSIDLTKNKIVNGAHSLFSVGLASYALEVFHQKRYKIRWNEPNPRVVQLTLDDNPDLPPPSSIRPFPWSKVLNTDNQNITQPIADQFTIKESGHLEVDGERFMIVPASLLERFVSTCLPHAPKMSNTDKIQFPNQWSESDNSILSVIISSVVDIFSRSERSVYITGKESWDAYLRAYLFDYGWGSVNLTSYDLNSFETTLILPKASLFPFSIGLMAGIWERAHGRKFKLLINEQNDSIQVVISSLLEYDN